MGDHLADKRAGHVAAWTGSRLVIWGGQNSAGLLSDGACLDLAANQWTALNLPGAPSARFGATAVWTGDRLIVWGGEGAEGVLRSGAQLVFDTNGAPVEWRTLAVPSLGARTRHSAVWTGSKMIVWGGRNGTPSYFADGGAYDPTDNSWTVLPAFGDLAARSGHCAVWTGQEMLVVGGEGAGGAMASGAAYHPASARWRLLSVAGNPQPRSQGSAVWTGGELLVFGGRAAGQPVGALQRLTPTPTWYLYRKP